MKQIRWWIRRYFGFSQRETTGFLVLLFMVVVALVVPFFINTHPRPYNPAKEQAALDSLVAHLDSLPSRSYPTKKYPNYARNKSKKPELRKFNPNTATKEELQQVGFSFFAANNILKYREKAGDFQYKEQLQRIYGVPEELYQQLYTYIDLPAAADRKQFARKEQFNEAKNTPYNNVRNKYPKPTRLLAFDINQADTTELKRIRGIGSKLSARIVKFRDRLGGFTSAEQLVEIYGLSPEVQDSLRKYTFVQAGFVPKTINLNTATFDELRAHPYIGYNLAKVIGNYRTQHGNFKTVDELKNIKVITGQQFQKLKPYLQL